MDRDRWHNFSELLVCCFHRQVEGRESQMALATQFIEKSIFHSIVNWMFFLCWRLYDLVPSKHWSSSMKLSLFRICWARAAKGNHNLNLNSTRRWWKSMSAPRLMALGAGRWMLGSGPLFETTAPIIQCQRQKNMNSIDFHFLPSRVDEALPQVPASPAPSQCRLRSIT